jgi:hypothetical protein
VASLLAARAVAGDTTRWRVAFHVAPCNPRLTTQRIPAECRMQLTINLAESSSSRAPLSALV